MTTVQRLRCIRPGSWVAMAVGTVSAVAMAAPVADPVTLQLLEAGEASLVGTGGVVGAGAVALWLLQRVLSLADRWTSLAEDVWRRYQRGDVGWPGVRVELHHAGQVSVEEPPPPAPGAA